MMKLELVLSKTAYAFQTLFNAYLRLGEIPLTWGKAIIKPIPKTRVPSKNPSEYRGISLQSVIAKTYCRLLNYRLRNWIEFNNILNEEQRMVFARAGAAKITFLHLTQ